MYEKVCISCDLTTTGSLCLTSYTTTSSWVSCVTMPPLQETPFRSAEMTMVQLYVSNDIRREVVTALGELGLCQFRDVSLHAHTIPSKQATHVLFYPAQ